MEREEQSSSSIRYRRTFALPLSILMIAISAAPAFAAEDANVLPAGRSRLSMIYAQTAGIDDQYDDTGHVASIAAPYNLELSQQLLSAADPQIAQLVKGLDTSFPNYHFNPNQTNNGYYGVTTNPNDELLGDALDRGFLNVSGQATQYQTMLSYQYGITDRLTVGFMVPYIRYDITINNSITGQNTAEDIYNALSSTGPANTGQASVLDQLRSYLAQFSSINDGTLQSFLQSRGYQPVTTDTVESGFGDVVVGGRYKYFDQNALGGHWLSSVQGGFTAPTGALKDPSQVAAQDLGTGAWQLGIADIVNYSPSNVFMFSTGIHFSQPFVASRSMRVRSDPTDIIPDAADQQEVTMHLGGSAQFTLGAQARLTDYLTLDSGYQWAWKGIDTYEGSRDIDYTYLSDDTFQYQETLSLGVNLSSIDRYLMHKAPLPGTLGIEFYIPTKGLNVPVAPYGVAQIALIF